MSNDIRKYNGCIETSDVGCYNNIVRPSPKNQPKQPKDTYVIDEHPYWNAFSDGFVEGFSLPFVAAFSVLGMVGCDSGNRLAHYPNEDVANLDTHGETSLDGGSDADGSAPAADVAEEVDAEILDGAELPPEDMSAEDAAGDATAVDGAELPLDDVSIDDTSDAAADLSEDVTAADGTELPPDMSVDDAADVQDAGADLADDATAADGVLPPEDTSVDAAIQDDVADVVDDTSDAAAPICQYFCDAGISETADAALPTDATPADDTLPPVVVTSKMCSGPSGNQTLSAPLNSVAVACTNGTLNSMILGAKSCVAECGFYDNNVVLSSNPNIPVAFALNLFIPPMPPMKPYTITLALQPPMLSGGSVPALPGFLGSSFVFAFNQQFYDDTGKIVWEAEDKEEAILKGTVQILYKPQDFFFEKPEILDITYTDLIGNKMSYRYPCDTLSDPIIQCTEVK